MTDTREATSGPWRINEYGAVVGEDGEQVMVNGFGWVLTSGPKQKEAKANAALIVRARNRANLWPEAIRIIKALYAAVLVDDEEGLAEHAEPMEAARALLSKLEEGHD